MTMRATGLLLLLTAACSQPAPTTARGPSPASSARVAPRGEIDPAVLEKICHAQYADSSSTVFQALGPEGDVGRLVVTPSHRIADMGNLIFDRTGGFLGIDTGSEVPWDDKAFMEQENRRVAALMGGSEIPKGSEPIRCK